MHNDFQLLYQLLLPLASYYNKHIALSSPYSFIRSESLYKLRQIFRLQQINLNGDKVVKMYYIVRHVCIHQDNKVALGKFDTVLVRRPCTSRATEGQCKGISIHYLVHHASLVELARPEHIYVHALYFGGR